MKLDRLTITRLPGVDTPFAVDFGEALTLVQGPNDSGKSSLCRALVATLWPDSLPGRDVLIDARWTDGDASVRCERSGRRVSWRRDGAEAGPPSLPAARIAPCYTIDCSDLFGGLGATEDEVAHEVRRRMVGGYDLDKILDARLPLDEQHGQTERVTLEARRRAYSAVQNEYRRLAEKEEELESLEELQAVAQQASAMLPELRSAVELAETRTELKSVKAALAGFPAGMEGLQGNELEQLDGIEAERIKLRESLAEIEARLEEARKRGEESGIKASAQAGDLEGGDAKLRRLQKVETEIQNRQEAKRSAQAQLSHAWRDLGGSMDVEQMQLDLPALAKLDAYLARAELLRHTRSNLESNSDFVGEGPDPVELEKLRQACDALREWLAASEAQGWWSTKWFVALLGGLGAAAGAFSGPSLPRPLSSVGFLAPLGGALLLGMIPVAFSAISKSPTQVSRERFEKSGRKPPENWTRGGVQDRLRVLDKDLAKAELSKQQDDRRSLLKEQLHKLKQEEAEHRKEGEALKAALGVDPGNSALGLVDVARRIQAWRGAKALVEECEAALQSGKQEFQRCLEEINQFLELWEYPRAADMEEAEMRLDNLRERGQAMREARTAVEHAQREFDRVQAQVQKLEERAAAIFVSGGIPAGDRDELQRRIDRVQEHREWKKKEDALESRVRAFAARLVNQSELKELGIEEARLREKEAQGQAAKLAGVAIEVGKIQEHIASTRQSRRMEAALAELEKARRTLAERRDEALRATAGRLLVEDVENEFREECLPAVLKRATDWTAAFTRHRYELRFLEGDAPEFRVVETSSGIERSLDELSGGTRAQVQLAVRLAVALHSESGTTLPILLDDALAGCDPARFRAIADAVLQLVQEGRQVVYLTASPSDAAYWQAISKELKAPAPKMVDLTEQRGTPPEPSEPVAPEVLEAPEAPSVPEPEGLEPAEYAAEVHVPPLDPFASADRLHLYYLLQDDLDLLKRLLDAGVETVGQWRAMGRTRSVREVVSQEQAMLLAGLSALAETCLDVWRDSHSRPVDRKALEGSGAVSEEFLDGLTQLAGEAQHDAHRLLESLQGERPEPVRGFFGSQVDELRAYLEKEGYLQSEAPVDADQLERRVLAGLAARPAAKKLDGQLALTKLHELLAVLGDTRGGDAPAAGESRDAAKQVPAG